MQELIERLEKATGPDRQLDSWIAAMTPHTKYTDDCEAGTYWEVRGGVSTLRTAPTFTGSLDTAWTLIPEKCWLGRMEQDSNVAGLGRRTFCCQIMWATETGLGEAISMYRPSPVLALCIAAIKARALLTAA